MKSKDLQPFPETLVQRGLFVLKLELKLLRQLEAADRRADPVNCRKSLSQRDALEALDNFRDVVRAKHKR